MSKARLTSIAIGAPALHALQARSPAGLRREHGAQHFLAAVAVEVVSRAGVARGDPTLPEAVVFGGTPALRRHSYEAQKGRREEDCVLRITLMLASTAASSD